jgi:hypothetical protein
MVCRRDVAPLVLLGLLAVGCGKGLTVELFATPNPANPGQSVDWTIKVRNDTPCATTGDTTELPDPFPDGAGVFAIFVGFDPGFGPGDAGALCREFMTTDCPDEVCLRARFEAAFGPTIAQVLSERAHEAMQQAHEPQQAGTCETIFNDTDGLIAFCAFDPLDPGETDMAMHTDTAPDTGNTNPAQIALAFGLAAGEDCRPGTEVEPGIWTVAGCFPVVPPDPAPVMSPGVMALAAALLFGAGIFSVRRLRKS